MAMAIERTEAAGLGVAVLGHLGLLAALSLGLFAATTAPPAQDAIEVSFVEDVALDSASPTPASAPPPPSAADELGPTEEAPATPDAGAGAAAPSTPAPAAVAPPRESDSRDRRRPEEPRQTPGQRNRAARLADLNLDNLGRDPARRPAPAARAARRR